MLTVVVGRFVLPGTVNILCILFFFHTRDDGRRNLLNYHSVMSVFSDRVFRFCIA